MPAKVRPYQIATHLTNQLKTSHNRVNPIAAAQKAINISVPINKSFPPALRKFAFRQHPIKQRQQPHPAD